MAALEGTVRSVLVHHVVLDEQRRTFSVTDDLQTSRWAAGGDPALRTDLELTLGRVHRRTFRRSYGVRSDSTVGAVGERSSTSAEGRALVTEAGGQLGWTQVRSTTELVSTIAAIVGGTAALAVVVGLLLALAL